MSWFASSKDPAVDPDSLGVSPQWSEKQMKHSKALPPSDDAKRFAADDTSRRWHELWNERKQREREQEQQAKKPRL